MPNLLLLYDSFQDWHVPLSESLTPDHTTTLLHVANLEKLQNPKFDASILSLDSIDILCPRMLEGPLGAVLWVTDPADVNGRVSAFASGATDCIAPDISSAELKARLASILRRRVEVLPSAQLTRSHAGTWYLNATRRYLVSPTGQRIELAGSTFELFLALASRPRRVLSRSFLSSALGNGKRTNARSIDVIVTRLRKILERHCLSGASIIATVRNEGYQLARDVQRDEHGIVILNT